MLVFHRYDIVGEERDDIISFFLRDIISRENKRNQHILTPSNSSLFLQAKAIDFPSIYSLFHKFVNQQSQLYIVE